MEIVVPEKYRQLTKMNQIRLQIMREAQDIFGAHIFIDNLQPLSRSAQGMLLLYSRTSQRD